QSCGVSTLPYGCTSLVGYSRLSGARCDVSTYAFKPGCDSFSGFSANTNDSCSLSQDKSPVISSLTGSRTLTPKKSGTWSLAFYDPNGEGLMPEVDWGDGGFTGSSIPPVQPFLQQYITFSHAYLDSGTHEPLFTIRNDEGYLAQRSLEVLVE
ncbi:MAG: hypothetical protein WCI76_03500, partial [bacterium]